MTEKHTVHLADGGKVVIDGDRVEVHLTAPIVVQRQHWIRYFSPEEEVRRLFMAQSPDEVVKKALKEAFRAVPMVAHPEDD